MIGPAGFMAAPRQQSEQRDWLEDSPHENGNYQCHCYQCGMFFTGHKRRVTCKVCADRALATAAPQTSTPASKSSEDGTVLDKESFK